MPFDYKEIPLDKVVADQYTASPQEIHDGLVLYRVNEHFTEALEHFPREKIVGCFLQGSQNYGLDYEGSDVDTKLIVVPDFRDNHNKEFLNSLTNKDKIELLVDEYCPPECSLRSEHYLYHSKLSPSQKMTKY